MQYLSENIRNNVYSDKIQTSCFPKEYARKSLFYDKFVISPSILPIWQLKTIGKENTLNNILIWEIKYGSWNVFQYCDTVANKKRL